MRLLLIAALLPAASAAAAAEDEAPPRFEVTLNAGYMIGGELEAVEDGTDLDLDDAASFALLFNARADASTQWEGLYARQSTDIDTAGLFPDEPVLDLDVHYLHVGGTYHGEGDIAQPYLVATIGITHLDPGPADFDEETRFSFSIGGGLRLLPGERIGVRLEGRLFSTLVDSDGEIFCRSDGGAVCAIVVDGSLLNQWQASAGVTFRF